jgi:hypothetical protein
VDGIRFRTLNEITSPIVPTGTTRLRPVRRELNEETPIRFQSIANRGCMNLRCVV